MLEQLPEWLKLSIVVITGLMAGFLNTVAGGGSLIALPLLIFLGLPPAEANGTNRISILFQNISAVSGFKSKGVWEFPLALYLGIAATAGAIIGAQIAVEIDERLFNRILSIILLLAIIPVVIKNHGNRILQDNKIPFRRKILAVIAFFFIGIYGGFIQAGVGFIIIIATTLLTGFDLVRVNSIKVFVILCYTFAAIGVFILHHKIDWMYGFALAVGSSSGGWMASRWSVKKGEGWIKWILAFMVVVMAVRLWFFS